MVPIGKSQVFKHFQDALIGNSTVEKGQVIAHGGLEKLHILSNHSDTEAQSMQVGLSDGDIPNTDLALLRVIHAKQKTGQSCLTATGTSEQTQHFTWLKLKGNV